MRLLFVGDVVGRSGRAILLEQLQLLRAKWALDFVVVNGENAAGGFGVTQAICEEFLDAGADAITLGNHAFDQREALVYIERQPCLIRPANFPKGTPGRGAALIEARNGARALVVNMMGRIFMNAMDDPFAQIDEELAACPLGGGCRRSARGGQRSAHAYACRRRGWRAHRRKRRTPVSRSSPQRVIVVAGHAGRSGSCLSIPRFTTKIQGGRLEPALGAATLCGVAVETGGGGLATKIAPVRIGGKLEAAAAGFWSA
jgi:2',3'-cyclic-nucleotide 2'-phosphodiesterase